MSATSLTVGEVVEKRAVVRDQLDALEIYKTRKIKWVASSRGTADEWKANWDIALGGAGVYELGPNEVLVVIRDGNRKPPPDYEEGKAHLSIRRHYGAVFFGVFYRFEPIPELATVV